MEDDLPVVWWNTATTAKKADEIRRQLEVLQYLLETDNILSKEES